MSHKARKEGQLFKRICSHDEYGEHHEEVMPYLASSQMSPQVKVPVFRSHVLCPVCSNSLTSISLQLQVTFPQMVRLTGIKVGAVAKAEDGAQDAYVHAYVRDLSTLGAARFACVAEKYKLPQSGTRAIRLEVNST